MNSSASVCSSTDGPLDMFDQCGVLACNTAENLDYLKKVIKEEAGAKRDTGSIWRD